MTGAAVHPREAVRADVPLILKFLGRKAGFDGADDARPAPAMAASLSRNKVRPRPWPCIMSRRSGHQTENDRGEASWVKESNGDTET